MFSKILKPTKRKLLVHAVISLCIVVVMLSVPSLGVQAIFLTLGIFRQVLSVVASFLFGFVYYPLTCGVLFLASTAARKKNGPRGIMLSVVFILFFNPITLSLIVSSLLPQRVQPKVVASCGFEITDFFPSSKGLAAGLQLGDVIRSVDRKRINEVADFQKAIAGKRPGDTVSVATDRGLFSLTLVESPEDPRAPFLAIKIRPAQCR